MKYYVPRSPNSTRTLSLHIQPAGRIDTFTVSHNVCFALNLCLSRLHVRFVESNLCQVNQNLENIPSRSCSKPTGSSGLSESLLSYDFTSIHGHSSSPFCGCCLSVLGCCGRITDPATSACSPVKHAPLLGVSGPYVYGCG
jgi:hypothetical protein